MAMLGLPDQLLNPGHHLIEPLAGFEISEKEWQVTAHPLAVSLHHARSAPTWGPDRFS
jgi:hypothetical protein